MAKSCNQKMKILYLMQLFQESTDESRVVSMQQILEFLGEKEIRAERKSIYDDLDTLRRFGLDIRYKKGKPSGYYLAGNIPQENQAPQKTQENQVPLHDQEQPLSPAPQESPVPEKISGEQEIPALKIEKKEKKLQGETKSIKLLCADSRKKQVLEYLGEEAAAKRKSPEFWSVTGDVVIGPEFYGWLTAMGKAVRLTKPKKEAVAYRDYLKAITKEYKG